MTAALVQQSYSTLCRIFKDKNKERPSPPSMLQSLQPRLPVAQFMCKAYADDVKDSLKQYAGLNEQTKLQVPKLTQHCDTARDVIRAMQIHYLGLYHEWKQTHPKMGGKEEEKNTSYPKFGFVDLVYVSQNLIPSATFEEWVLSWFHLFPMFQLNISASFMSELASVASQSWISLNYAVDSQLASSHTNSLKEIWVLFLQRPKTDRPFISWLHDDVTLQVDQTTFESAIEYRQATTSKPPSSSKETNGAADKMHTIPLEEETKSSPLLPPPQMDPSSFRLSHTPTTANQWNYIYFGDFFYNLPYYASPSNTVKEGGEGEGGLLVRAERDDWVDLHAETRKVYLSHKQKKHSKDAAGASKQVTGSKVPLLSATSSSPTHMLPLHVQFHPKRTYAEAVEWIIAQSKRKILVTPTEKYLMVARYLVPKLVYDHDASPRHLPNLGFLKTIDSGQMGVVVFESPDPHMAVQEPL